MTTESYQNTKSADTGDSTSENDEVVIDNGNVNKHSFLIIAGSLLAMLVLVVAGQNVGQDLSSSANEIVKGASALADYQVDTANSALNNDIFGMVAVSENEEGNCVNPNGGGISCNRHGPCKKICGGSCMCQEYCDRYCDCSDYFQYRCRGCCCNVDKTNPGDGDENSGGSGGNGWAQPNPICPNPCDGVAPPSEDSRNDDHPCGCAVCVSDGIGKSGCPGCGDGWYKHNPSF